MHGQTNKTSEIYLTPNHTVDENSGQSMAQQPDLIFLPSKTISAKSSFSSVYGSRQSVKNSYTDEEFKANDIYEKGINNTLPNIESSLSWTMSTSREVVPTYREQSEMYNISIPKSSIDIKKSDDVAITQYNYPPHDNDMIVTQLYSWSQPVIQPSTRYRDSTTLSQQRMKEVKEGKVVSDKIGNMPFANSIGTYTPTYLTRRTLERTTVSVNSATDTTLEPSSVPLISANATFISEQKQSHKASATRTVIEQSYERIFTTEPDTMQTQVYHTANLNSIPAFVSTNSAQFPQVTAKSNSVNSGDKIVSLNTQIVSRNNIYSEGAGTSTQPQLIKSSSTPNETMRGITNNAPIVPNDNLQIVKSKTLKQTVVWPSFTRSEMQFNLEAGRTPTKTPTEQDPSNFFFPSSLPVSEIMSQIATYTTPSYALNNKENLSKKLKNGQILGKTNLNEDTALTLTSIQRLKSITTSIDPLTTQLGNPNPYFSEGKFATSINFDLSSTQTMSLKSALFTVSTELINGDSSVKLLPTRSKQNLDTVSSSNHEELMTYHEFPKTMDQSALVSTKRIEAEEVSLSPSLDISTISTVATTSQLLVTKTVKSYNKDKMYVSSNNKNTDISKHTNTYNRIPNQQDGQNTKSDKISGVKRNNLEKEAVISNAIEHYISDKGKKVNESKAAVVAGFKSNNVKEINKTKSNNETGVIGHTSNNVDIEIESEAANEIDVVSQTNTSVKTENKSKTVNRTSVEGNSETNVDDVDGSTTTNITEWVVTTTTFQQPSEVAGSAKLLTLRTSTSKHAYVAFLSNCCNKCLAI